MVYGIRQTIIALSTVVDLCIEGKVIPTEFLVLPEAKGNRTLLELDFLNAQLESSLTSKVENGIFPEILRSSTKRSRKLNILLDRNEARFQPGREPMPFIEHRIDTGDHSPIPTSPNRINPVKEQDCQKENFDRRRRRKYYKPGNKVWVTIHPISRNNRSSKLMPKREGPYLILTLRSTDYQEPETERNTDSVASLRKRRRPKKKLPPGSKPRRQRNKRSSLYKYAFAKNKFDVEVGSAIWGMQRMLCTGSPGLKEPATGRRRRWFVVRGILYKGTIVRNPRCSRRRRIDEADISAPVAVHQRAANCLEAAVRSLTVMRSRCRSSRGNVTCRRPLPVFRVVRCSSVHCFQTHITVDLFRCTRAPIA
ncbi:uncharacterized protein TNCV_2275181 [Trichonephila clavipes]|nr:uncharacterized protein TNCV_2275181 [Trichonephila clavipes]